MKQLGKRGFEGKCIAIQRHGNSIAFTLRNFPPVNKTENLIFLKSIFVLISTILEDANLLCQAARFFFFFFLYFCGFLDPPLITFFPNINSYYYNCKSDTSVVDSSQMWVGLMMAVVLVRKRDTRCCMKNTLVLVVVQLHTNYYCTKAAVQNWEPNRNYIDSPWAKSMDWRSKL